MESVRLYKCHHGCLVAWVKKQHYEAEVVVNLKSIVNSFGVSQTSLFTLRRDQDIQIYEDKDFKDVLKENGHNSAGFWIRMTDVLDILKKLKRSRGQDVFKYLKD